MELKAVQKSAVVAALMLAALAACAPQQNANVLPASQAMTAQDVQFGTITGSRAVMLQGGEGGQLLGAVVGGVAGAALGNEVGRGTGQDVATALGATAGVAAGQAAGRAAGNRQSIEWFVQLDNGRTISVVQGEPAFGVGQRVRVISGGGQTRLTAA